MKRNRVIIGAALAVLAIAVGWLALKPSEQAAVQPKEKGEIAGNGRPKSANGRRIAEPRRGGGGSAQTGKKTLARAAAKRVVEDNLSPADRKLADDVQAALDDDDFGAVSKAVEAAMDSTSPEVRRAAVDALAWFGEKSLVQLTKALADKDADVAEAARGQVEQVLMGIDDDAHAFSLAASYVDLFAGDAKASAMFLGVLSSAAVRIVDPDEADSQEAVDRARANRATIVRTLAKLIECEGETGASAKEAYQTVTGDDWTGREAANHWAADIPDPAPEEAPAEESPAEEEAAGTEDLSNKHEQAGEQQ